MIEIKEEDTCFFLKAPASAFLNALKSSLEKSEGEREGRGCANLRLISSQSFGSAGSSPLGYVEA